MMAEKRLILNSGGVQRALAHMAREIARRNEPGDAVVLIGVARGGVPLAQRLGTLLTSRWKHSVPVGSVDIGMYRDDLNQRSAPQIHPTVIPFDLNGKTVVLVDDVLFSGRSVRAAMDALNDFGRPNCIQLAALIDRGHRELPINADFVGKSISTSLAEIVRVELTEDGGLDEVRIEEQ
jgi:pyrimidine operon attenuation protein / uracil phosphoribosyltransferase